MNEVLWAFGRVSGVVALLLLTLSLLLGITARSGRTLPGLPRFSITLVHRNVALLACVFLVFHVGSLLLDPFARLNPVDAFVPFLGSFKPFWQGLGTVAVDLLLAVIVTSWLRSRLGVRTFKAVHWLTYALWPVALGHAIGNGTNGTNTWFLLLSGLSIAAVVAALGWRMSTRFLESADARGRSAS
jgi:predicted ferric reductase